MKTPFEKRRRALQSALKERRLSVLLVTKPANWFYLTGFTGDSGALLVSQNDALLVTDGRFTVQAKEEMSGVSLLLQEKSLAETVGSVVARRQWKHAGFDPTQLSVGFFHAIKRAAGKNVQWVEAAGLVEALREKKEPAEIAVMKQAALLAGRVMQAGFKLLRPGIREIDVATELEYQMRQLGASGPSFETIVAFGARSALPHARPTAKRLKKNELVVLDLGVILANYCSDMTRTVCLGRVPARVRRWHKAVQEAEQAAIETVRAGVTCGEVDAAARKVLSGYRLERYFVHSTGHGLGLEVHEGPRVARGQTQTLVPGNVVTIEPGVYMPGIGGIRIEDDVAVLEGRTKVLTRVRRDLLEL